jgi:hypothetical protein
MPLEPIGFLADLEALRSPPRTDPRKSILLFVLDEPGYLNLVLWLRRPCGDPFLETTGWTSPVQIPSDTEFTMGGSRDGGMRGVGG